MGRFAFVGPSYSSQSLNADCQRCLNWYPEAIESGQGKGPMALYPREGLVLFSQLPTGPVRGEYTVNGRTFAVGGGVLYEVLANGTPNALTAVVDDGLPVYFAAGATQLAVCSGGNIYVLTLATNVITTVLVGALLGASSQIAFVDGFFLSLIFNSQKIQYSALEDATSWPGSNVFQVSVFPDNVAAIMTDHRELCIFGNTKIVVYYNSGDATNPFVPIPGAFVEQGTIAAASPLRLDNTVMWMGGDERGAGIFWRAEGYRPTRVSNHAVETAWAGYSTISDLITFPYQNNGHSFAVLYFPTANATWVFDVATQMWHERDNFIGATGKSQAYLARCHTFNFGKHLVGDWNSGNIYSLSTTVFTDNTLPIRWVRRAPHISAEQQQTYYGSLQVDLEAGLGPQPPLLDVSGNPRGPTLSLRWSNDGAKTWSNYYDVDCGQAGNYLTRAIWRRLGRARDRVYEISTTDPVPWRIIDAYLKALGPSEYGPQSRLVHELGKRA
jgi:hypothetical protein